MKKPLLIPILLLFFFTTYSQDPNVLNRDWHIHELFIDGDFNDIPDLAANPPSDCILGLHIELVGGIYFMDLGICTMYGANLDNFDLTTFTVDDFGGLAGSGPCYSGSTTDGCTAIPGYGELADFEYIHHGFYEDFQSTFTYAIQPPGLVGYETLLVQKSNGDYALYGEVEPLSVTSNNFNDFSVYPNPALDVLYLKGTIQDIKAVTVYTLSGKKINAPKSGSQIDVSELKTGLYFMEITLESGAKHLQRFIKN